MSRRARKLTALVAGVLGALAVAAPAHATFPGENGRIAVEGPSCCFNPDPKGFYTMNPDGSDLRATPVGLTVVLDVAWSPDGERVAFTAAPEGRKSGDSELYTAAADGSDPRRLTFDDTTEHSVSWSPDGKWIAVLTGTETTPDQLAVISAEGGDMRFLRTVDSIMAEWSPAGDTIAIAEPLSGIQLIPVEGGDATTIAPDANVRSFSWAPTGKTLVFNDCSSEFCDLFKVNSDGSGVEPLVQRGGRDYIDAPLWSPDGKTIVFCRALDGEDGFWAVDANGGEPRLVQEGNQACGHWQSWQPVLHSVHIPPIDPCRPPVEGTPGPDSMKGGNDPDRLLGLGGDDEILGRRGPDCLFGGRGADFVRGGRGADTIWGGRGNDRLAGGPDGDTIYAGRGRDRVRGGPGGDLIDVRGGGNDTVDCGAGEDRAYVSKSDTVLNCEHVTRASAPS
jgi:hypothetical protein